VGSHRNTKNDRRIEKTPDEGIGRCEHDTPSEIHNQLWGIYDKHTKAKPPEKPKVEVKLGPYEEEVINPGKQPKKAAWVIINLSRNDITMDQAEANARQLADELNRVDYPNTKATFKVLKKASPEER